MDAPQYPEYHSQYWYPQAHSTGHYSSSYPTGADVQQQFSPQVVPVYSPVQALYSASAFHPSNPFYGAEPQRPSSGPFPNQGCPAEQSSGGPGQPPPQHQRHHYPTPHCQGGSGYPAGPYPPYSDSTPNPPYPTSQPLPPSSQADTWSHPGGFGPSQQPWQPGQPSPQNHYVRPAHPPAWPGTGSGAPPPYQPKDQKQQGGPPLGGRPRPGPPSKPSGSAEISSPPQLYPRSRRAESDPPAAQSLPSPSPAPSPARAAAPAPGQAAPQALGLARVQEVVSRVLLLQDDVDEFVGRKTDKSYRCLEELLTKELLVLDSVETGGQETVRQARKEAVQRIQAILDQLERKAF